MIFYILLVLFIVIILIGVGLAIYEFKIGYHKDSIDENEYNRYYLTCKIVIINWIVLLILLLICGGAIHNKNKKDYIKGFVGLYQYINYVDTTKDYEHYAEVLEHLSTQNEDLLIFVTANGYKLKPEQSFELLKIYLVSNELQQTQIINTLKN